MLCVSVQYFREQLKLFICLCCISLPKYFEIPLMLKLSTEFPGVVTFGLGKSFRRILVAKLLTSLP